MKLYTLFPLNVKRASAITGPIDAVANFAGAIAGAITKWHKRRELYALNDRLLADAGFTREDIPAVVNGTYVRQLESAPVERPLGLRPAHVAGGTAGVAANDDEAQIAA